LRFLAVDAGDDGDDIEECSGACKPAGALVRFAVPLTLVRVSLMLVRVPLTLVRAASCEIPLTLVRALTLAARWCALLRVKYRQVKRCWMHHAHDGMCLSEDTCSHARFT
jgi:hypothetical protein